MKDSSDCESRASGLGSRQIDPCLMDVESSAIPVSTRFISGKATQKPNLFCFLMPFEKDVFTICNFIPFVVESQ